MGPLKIFDKGDGSQLPVFAVKSTGIFFTVYRLGTVSNELGRGGGGLS